MSQFCRTEMLIGSESVQKLKNSHVAVFGLGGVGSYTAEILARSGVGTLTIVDDDFIAESNLNRQLYALHSTIGNPKTLVAARRIVDINPNCKVIPCQMRFDATTSSNFDFASFDYVVDAIDTVTSKLLLAEICNLTGTKIISCMGTGNKLNPMLFTVADIYQTSVCPLCKVMRHELKRRGISALKVVYSTEEPIVPTQLEESSKRQTPGSMPFVPPVAGMLLASVVVSDICNLTQSK